MRYIFPVVLLCLLSGDAFSQTYTTRKNATGAAKSAFEEGVEQINRQEYEKALASMNKALKKAPDFIDAYISMSGAYIDLQQWPAGEEALEKAIAIDPLYDARVLYACAVTEWEQNKFEEAATHAAAYLNTNPKNEDMRYRARRLEENAQFAAVGVKNPVPFNPKSVGDGVNTGDEEYLPSLTADGSRMIFTRQVRRNEDFFISEWKDGRWQTAKPVEEVNTTENEGAQTFTADGAYILFSRQNREPEKGMGSFDIYWSQYKDNAWGKPNPFSTAINSPAWDSHPSMSADGKTLFFSSERPGGQGGKDLWFSEKMDNGKWGAPQNMGPKINTKEDEQTPFIHPDGQTLYFTSNGLPGMGSNDIYYIRRNPDRSWGTPQNLGYPINTKGKEGTLVVSLDGRTAYYAFASPEKKQHDIYTFSMPEIARPLPVTYVRGHVRDGVLGKATTADVEITDIKTAKPFYKGVCRADGTFLVCLPAGVDYALAVQKKNYLFYSENFHLADTATFLKPYTLEIVLQPIPKEAAPATEQAPKPVVLQNVFFQINSAVLLPESRIELDRLAALLTDNAALKIQINGHTDNTGEEQANLTLSENRAKAVYDYLVGKNIEVARLRYRGFGENAPIDTNDTPEGRSRNRRTEFVAF